ncbi:ABC-2 transporter permease [Gorillibacterium massiliense]|uniref:ABC-2 transporter permease n=1 Tax=Gorillibacterium massiliense TaxID=1280390 RepID=UPI0004B7B79B|nr:ABC-2 transporter permease [Gorillibacterium massiliense]
MITILKKDFAINKKYIYIAILYTILFPFALKLDGGGKTWFMNVLLPLVNVGIIVGKSCYIEDSQDVKVFLRSLPIRESTIIACRYMEALLILAITQIYILAAQYFLVDDSYTDMMRISWLSVACFLIYFSIYLFLYFWKNYFYAQNSVYVMIGLFFVIGILAKNSLDLKIDFPPILSTPFIIIANLIAFLIYGASYKLAKEKASKA